MIIECIVAGVAGVFVGAIWASQEMGSKTEENAQLKQKLNHLQKVGKLHIGKVVYACKYNSFHMGEITKITHSERETTIVLNNQEVFRVCDIYTDKDEALQQIKI